MAYNTTKAITEGYYLAGLVARDGETVSGSQLNDGLRYFNALLSLKSINGRFIPYYTRAEFNTVAGQSEYFIENLIEIDPLTFNINTVRFPSERQRRKKFFGEGRADNVRSLPVTWHFERCKGGGMIYFYFTPDVVYPIKYMGKFSLESVGYETDLSEVYDQFYIDYLTYQLARRICQHNQISVPPDTLSVLREYDQSLRDLMPMDLSMEKVSTLQRNRGMNYAIANLCVGFLP